MGKLIIKFVVPLERDDLEGISSRHGPLFHRWLPDGENDEISIKRQSKNVRVKLWFERCGYINDRGWISFDYKRREIDSDTLSRQAKVDAGPLYGKIFIKDLKSEEVKAVVENKLDDEEYIKVGKKITKIINKDIIPFINYLRNHCGQYWVKELHPWNSQAESLGSYFMRISAKWSVDESAEWQKFLPDKLESRAVVTINLDSDYSPYLSKDNWLSLESFNPEQCNDSLSIKLLSRAHQLNDEGNIRQSFVEGVTSLELALNEFFQKRVNLGKSLRREMKSFWQLPLHAQLTTVASCLPNSSHDDIEIAIRAIRVRNKIVHEGFNPRNDFETKKIIKALFRIISKLLSDIDLKFPSASNSGNTLFPKEG